MDETQQERVFGRTFQDLDQVRRIKVLRAYGALDDDLAQVFGRIRGLRRKHLHLAQLIDDEAVARDARQVFWDAVQLVRTVIGQDFDNGKIVVSQPMMRYLERLGRATPPESPDSGN